MNLFLLSALVSFVLNIAIGFTVFFMNPKRKPNRYFLLASMALALWLSFLMVGSWIARPERIVLAIRYGIAASCLLLPAFDLLRLAIMNPRGKGVPLRDMRFWALLLVPQMALLHMPSFVADVNIAQTGFPQPVYGWPVLLFIPCYLVGIATLLYRFMRHVKRSRGIQKAELGFTVLASAIATFFGFATGTLIPVFANYPDSAQLMPLIGIVLNTITAYGIATRRIMDVGEALRRTISYGLMAATMAVLYLITLSATHWALATFLDDPSTLAHMLAAIAVAFSIGPAQGRSRRLTAKLLGQPDTIDVRKLRTIQEELSRIAPLDDLTRRFGQTMRTVADADSLFMLQRRQDAYEQIYPDPAEGQGMRLAADSPLIGLLQSRTVPVTVEELDRSRPFRRIRAAISALQDLQVNMALGIQVKRRMNLVMLFGRRTSGRIYTAQEQDALQVVGHEFGLAFENAKLYTELQHGKIYNELLVDSLTSGIFAVDSNGRVSVFNKEAQRISGISADRIVGAPAQKLPGPLAQIYRETLENGAEILNRELEIDLADAAPPVAIRASCSLFHNHGGAALGALGVFSDITPLKKLEAQVRRSDRLSSLGTLAAGMAHEIKNPLVSISTFTQLFPERYADEDFRETFSRLIGAEVQRIDTIVNRLLHFARPTRPNLRDIRLHDALEDSIRLVSEQMQRKSIQVVKRLEAQRDTVWGDRDLLGQALINFLLNAIDAMDQGGTLTLSTRTVPPALHAGAGAPPCVRLDIADSGVGIPAEHLPEIFDPFFTSKKDGTGLGLAVSHSILDEHNATVEVESVPGQGTTFRIAFHLLDPQESPP